VTKEQQIRVTADMSRIAGETVLVNINTSTILVFGTELGCLRIFYKFRHNATACVDFSKPLSKWVFQIETNF
jgi:hypothetical protein